MAKRMKYSVVGLPHYTIWHLYEPSVDDIRHMEEMEIERKQREQDEKLKKEMMDKIENQFEQGTSQWEKDKEGIRDISKKAAQEKAGEKAEQKQKVAKVAEDSVADEA